MCPSDLGNGITTREITSCPMETTEGGYAYGELLGFYDSGDFS